MLLNRAKLGALKPAPTKAATASERATVALEGYEEYAAIYVCHKELEDLKEQKRTELMDQLKPALVDEGIRRKAKPETVKLAEGIASGSGGIQKRRSNVAFNDQELAALAEIFTEAELAGILQTREKVPELIAINPAYAADTKLLEKIEKALEKVPGIPADLFQLQEAITATIVTEDVLEVLFRSGDNKVKAAVDILGTFMIRPVCKNVVAAWDKVRPMLAMKPEAAKAKAKDVITDQLRRSLEQEESPPPARRRA